MKNFEIIQHPIIKREVSILRDKKTSNNIFRVSLKRLSIFMAYEVAKKFQLKKFQIETPITKTLGFDLKENIILVPVLRAGLGMVDGFLEVFPNAKVGHIGLSRNEKTLEPIDYYFKVPKQIDKSIVILLDPMLATGGSANAALNFLKKNGAKKIIYVCLFASPFGIKKILTLQNDIKIFTASKDLKLNKSGYIIPGLGDAGDRIFGTDD